MIQLIKADGKFNFSIAPYLVGALLIWLPNVSMGQVLSNNSAVVSLTSGAFVVSMDVGNASGTIANNGTIQLSGSYTNGGTTSGNGTFQLGGDWTNNGTFSAGSGTLTFNGTALQHMGGSASAQNFNNVIVSNSSGVVLGGSGSFTINGSMTISNGSSLDLPTGPVLTFGSGASITTTGTGKIILQSGSNYVNLSSSAPTLQAQTNIAGSAGWRMLASPDNVTVGSMFAAPFVTQGFTGSSYPSLQPNLLWWDETSQGTSLQAWRDPSSTSDGVALGRGYMFYVFDGAQRSDTASMNYSDVLPLTMSASGTEQPLTTAFDFGVTATTRSAGGPSDTTYVDSNAVDYGWNLVGNPTPSTIDWDASPGWTKTNMDGTIYIWDPADTSGGYKTWNGTTGNLGSGLVAPFQAFWVKANGAGPSLKCDNGVKSTGGSFLGKIAMDSAKGSPLRKLTKDSSPLHSLVKVGSDSTARPPVLRLDLLSNGIQTQANFMFSDAGKLTYDPYDAFSLVPPSDKYLILYSVAGQGQPAMQIQDLPDTGFADPFILPLYVGGTKGGQPLDGSFTLRWTFEGQIPSGWSIALMDDSTGKAYNMVQEGELTFRYNTPPDLVPSGGNFLQKKSSLASTQRSPAVLPRPVVHTVPVSKLSKGAGTSIRFRVAISARNDFSGYLPSTPDLAQNYPNPFNPSTNISFWVPSPTRVTIQVFNVLGQRVATVTDREYPTGKYLVTWTARGAASGVYFCRMIAGTHVQTKKMVLVR